MSQSSSTKVSLPVVPFDLPPAPKEITRAVGRVTNASVSAIMARPMRQYPQVGYVARDTSAEESSA